MFLILAHGVFVSSPVLQSPPSMIAHKNTRTFGGTFSIPILRHHCSPVVEDVQSGASKNSLANLYGDFTMKWPSCSYRHNTEFGCVLWGICIYLISSLSYVNTIRQRRFVFQVRAGVINCATKDNDCWLCVIKVDLSPGIHGSVYRLIVAPFPTLFIKPLVAKSRSHIKECHTKDGFDPILAWSKVVYWK